VGLVISKEVERPSHPFISIDTEKTTPEESFEAISGSNGKYFNLPIKGLKDLIRNGTNAWPAIMYETFGPEGIGKINKTLMEYGIRPEELEIEYLEPYPFVLENLEKRSVSVRTQ
jgi:uncharacterized Fe-S cluster-containing radical SAM superfamily protein